MSTYFFSAFGTFGNPNGFRQSYWFTDNINVVKGIKTFDLKTDAITLFPKSKIYSIRKELANGSNALAYNIYTFAKEQNSDRGGTFIGSSILYLNSIAEENSTINCLNEFHNNLVLKNVKDDIIVVNHSDSFSILKPKDFDKLNFQLKEVEDLNFGQSSNRNLVVYSQTSSDKLQQLFKKSIDLLNFYDTIYFTDSEEVARYVNRKGIFKLVEVEGFEQEIKKLQEERKQKIESSISEFENEKQRLEADRKRLIEEFTYQIEQNKILHQENSKKIEESENDLKQINHKYDGYSKKIDESINNLKSAQKLEIVRQIHNENKKIFIDSVNQQTQPKFINKILKQNSKTELRQPVQPSQPKSFEQDFSSQYYKHRRKKGLDIFKIMTAVLFLLWIGTLTYFLVFHTKGKEIVEIESQQNKMEIVEPPKVETVPAKELSPKPNSELSEKDYKMVAKKIKNNMPVKDIIQIIFDANPTDVKSNYSTQFDEYAKLIVEINKDCFKEDNNNFFFLKDTLRHIPSYKK